MQSLISNTIDYKLCLNDEAKSLFMNSLQELVKSKCSDFMVYRVVNGNIRNLPDYNEWQETVEIDEDTYGELHLNLCQKIGKIVRRGVI
ncbi:hypothetical protein SAMN06265377_3620 [Flagellimonas pacifica]|uniref:Uncharacterized protein n=2 Tax=Flagellimonas pacifica TaxID=1247520 RepID=A0A285MX71_9FLAO|nr:hypothetical protein SAMN06265377_3620 [Allomuricauda parva]